MYNATLYLNTGFNAVNVPDSLATLNLVPAANKVTVPALDIYQARELSTFVIKVTNYAQIRDADYLYLVNSNDATDFAFYSIQNIRMTSMDTAVLSVTMDYLLTAGGVANLEFTDGMCERHHVSDDTFGLYDEDDPYMMPAEMLKIETAEPDFTGGNILLKNNVIILESTVDLYQTNYDLIHGITGTGIDYESSANNVVTVPSVYSASLVSSTLMDTDPNPTSATPSYETLLPGVTIYISPDGDISLLPSGHDNSWLPHGLAVVRSLGIESCILAQYCIPLYMISGASFDSYHQHGEVEKLYGADKRIAISSLPFIRTYSNVTVRNNRLFYGSQCKYTIMSLASGNEASFLPEEIYLNDQDHSTSPVIEMRVDPRPKGCPYFRFDVYRGNTDTNMFFVNSVKGLEWQNAPLVYEQASGSRLNQYSYNASRALADYNMNYEAEMGAFNIKRAGIEGLVGGVSQIGAGIAGIGTGSVGIGAAGIAAGVSTIVDAGFDAYVQSKELENRGINYNIQKNAELQALLIKNNVVAPSMNFPISEGIRDYVGNGCIVYRTYYTDNDAERIDKILTMYGYRHTTPITTSLLTNRRKFNYIQAAGVTVKNTGIPKWIRDGIGVQLSVGTRIWHQLPDTSAYTDGTNTVVT